MQPMTLVRRFDVSNVNNAIRKIPKLKVTVTGYVIMKECSSNLDRYKHLR